MSNKPELSIVILNYNTKDLLRDCLMSLENVEDEAEFEVIVVDNASTDGSVEMLMKEFPEVNVIQNDRNLGFGIGNNAAKNAVKGDYVLFLNTDTVVEKGAIKETLQYLKDNEDVGAISCKLVLSDGNLDKDTRRSFPTPWVAFTHFSGLDRLFSNSKLFSKYWYGYMSEDKVHEVDVLQGAFFMASKDLLDDVGWFDKDYYLDGEDIDLSWKIKRTGKKLVYYPKVSILHYKGATKGKNKQMKNRPGIVERFKFAMRGVDSMEIFYRKRMWEQYPLIINFLVIAGIKGLKVVRLFKRVLF